MQLRSFTFFMAFWPLGQGMAQKYEFADLFTRRLPGTIMLPPGRSQLTLVCNGMGAWDAFKASQGDELIYDADE
jgi:hypothetical protein